MKMITERTQSYRPLSYVKRSTCCPSLDCCEFQFPCPNPELAQNLSTVAVPPPMSPCTQKRSKYGSIQDKQRAVTVLE